MNGSVTQAFFDIAVKRSARRIPKKQIDAVSPLRGGASIGSTLTFFFSIVNLHNATYNSSSGGLRRVLCVLLKR